MIYLGLTGSIGAGKSTVLQMIKNTGIPTYSADEIVHQLFEHDAGLTQSIQNLFPSAVVDGRINIKNLSEIFDSEDLTLIQEIESKIHPKVYEQIHSILQHHKKLHTPLVCVEIPLLFETLKNFHRPDIICVVHTTASEQRRRVLSRPGMTLTRLQKVLHRQMPAHEKLKMADWILYSCGNLANLEQRVNFMLKTILSASAMQARS
ncbi:MAG: dephospho-CoA kinase [Alphaproteobacteria bacterium]|nr:dephospho-CoA kinase [Alphaproteobacteria bacterium]OJV47163.1 MAG: dephospho-CoA kinase [Alphaproteobacteria bacterium 43-37]